ncbi:hypothetical protein ACNHKD_18935 [Methylocystis sp. JAN1]|uniref:hypothetical protein n=1 Tax=Methylocystis sp. JAN1 TaxID=3397211 RepID=UPI003FA2792F
MNVPVKIAISAAFVCGFSALASSAASAMPVANVGLAPATEEAHAIRVCNRWGRCWWSYAGHYHGRYGYGWGRPYYGGYRYGWRRPYHGYGWHGHRYGYGWGGRGWHGSYGWRGGHGRWR